MFRPLGAPRILLPILAFCAVYALLAVTVENSYHQLTLTLVPVWAIFGLSWNLLSGMTGLISFGHAAFFGLGAYTVALLFVKAGLTPWLGIPVAGLVGGLSGLLIGLPTFRLRGHYFALAMLAYPLALLNVFLWLGYQEVSLPLMRDSGWAFMQFADHRVYILIALGLLLAAMLAMRLVERSRYGMALMAIKQNEAAAEAVGIDTRRLKLVTIALSGALAGAIGGFHAVILLVVTPEAVFGMLISAQALTVAMFGGVGTVWGPVLGALVLIPLGETLHARFGAVLPGIQGVVFGTAIIAVILLAPEGLYWKAADLLRRRRAGSGPEAVPQGREGPAAPPTPAARTAPGPEAPAILRAEGVSKSFGGVRAVREVSFTVRRGEILGVIGPNGAGKTTLFNLLNGFVRPDAGRVLLDGRDVTGVAPNRLCRAGVGRTFQVVRPFARMSVADNVMSGAQVHAASAEEAREMARRAMRRVGLGGMEDARAGALSNLDLRLMELARALAGNPRLLLLDETFAGLGAPEVEQLLGVIRGVAAEGVTVVIIEHTLHAMVRLVDRFVVLDNGAVLAEGLPQEVTGNRAVVEAYLGSKWIAHAGD
ncbi:branched-chain amino acid ABC transporter ATP-binding protein/permease [Teichococcus vastitatis]|uniref:Branched-chain amino acid ABC transporter ATP-binding protein/permease n=1 Tax=Teichococcus vastitatis TaxID=2307076 RepID=A0ABS9W6Z6_9PROT|nr:branched-chain amino acid ABC transporter ATP-binding protein/permease [Pseudoroseomonas vastitatis]MCI0755012.1 branched-chain amino acid ABC transporter ATP-binding protein/permease [Pseudoroseomonas vastitatis]